MTGGGQTDLFDGSGFEPSDFASDRNQEMLEACVAYDKAHPEVWTLFVKFTNELIDRTFKHHSARAIFHRIRWETDAADPRGRPTFKINNNHSPFYARRFMRTFPEYAGFFRTRKQNSRQRPPTRRRELGTDHFPTWPQPPRQIAP